MLNKNKKEKVSFFLYKGMKDEKKIIEDRVEIMTTNGCINVLIKSEEILEETHNLTVSDFILILKGLISDPRFSKITGGIVFCCGVKENKRCLNIPSKIAVFFDQEDFGQTLERTKRDILDLVSEAWDSGVKYFNKKGLEIPLNIEDQKKDSLKSYEDGLR